MMHCKKRMNKKQRHDQQVLIPVSGKAFILSDWRERNQGIFAKQTKHNKVKKAKVLRGMR